MELTSKKITDRCFGVGAIIGDNVRLFPMEFDEVKFREEKQTELCVDSCADVWIAQLKKWAEEGF
jgi:hypothetical protein